MYRGCYPLFLCITLGALNPGVSRGPGRGRVQGTVVTNTSTLYSRAVAKAFCRCALRKATTSNNDCDSINVIFFSCPPPDPLYGTVGLVAISEIDGGAPIIHEMQ